VEALDETLCRVWQLTLLDPSDEVDDEIDRLLSPLIEVGYVHESGRSATGSLWRFTPEGVRRVEELGCDDPAVG